MSQRKPEDPADSHEGTDHSFIIRIWLEEILEDGQSRWRGHITHVPSKRRRYFEGMGEIDRFIAPYLVVNADDKECPAGHASEMEK